VDRAVETYASRVRLWSVSCPRTDEVIETLFEDRLQWAQVDGRPHWRHLAHTVEPSARGCDAALCQITLTSCFVRA